MPIHIIVMRHGERLDEADRKAWHKVRTAETQHDPPLTSLGWDQATSAGTRVAHLIGDGQLTIYSSPTARTLSTAAAAAISMGTPDTGITPAYALNCCAAAQRFGVVEGFPTATPDPKILGGVALSCWPPVGDPTVINRRQSRGGGFVQAVQELAANHTDGDVLMMITHREGIWELLRHVGSKPANGGYCNCTFFEYEPTSRTLASWNASGPIEGTRRVRASVGGSRPSAVVEALTQRAVATPAAAVSRRGGADDVPAEAAKESDGLAALLARGSGRVMIHRGDVKRWKRASQAGSGNGTLLWKTPGVRGVWADGGPVADGEIVELLSSPQSSEGDEGDFVFVRRSCGVEAWTKLKNVHLPQD